MIITQQIKNGIQRYIDENRLTLCEFASKCKTTQPTVSRWLNGQTKKLSGEHWDIISSLIPMEELMPKQPNQLKIAPDYISDELPDLGAISADEHLILTAYRSLELEAQEKFRSQLLVTALTGQTV